ncbi:chemotaxis protein CheB [Dyadobacter arcticus]|uniref:protein-glutamate methylesterase n=1 Tax=Dyadobacter arcticus TaxID=1078754 RepID=A0ABX0UR26_9BACT|nr:chemotaxis protein CheB [Dyadobacter arcticus]NIJ54050.1 two-component system chemotaxis response regulator CheB [Dyadobacter arcticus]
MNIKKDDSLSLVLIGGSSGSFVIFEEILKLLVQPLSFAIVFVLHRGKSSTSVLPELFRNRTNVFMSEPHHLDTIETNTVYFAFPDYHLLIGPDGRFYYDLSEKVFFSRPCIDATFISAAFSGIPVKAALLLSGSSADGAFGVKVLAQKGFATYVLNPKDAESPRMPEAALQQYDKHTIIYKSTLIKVVQDILYSHAM